MTSEIDLRNWDQTKSDPEIGEALLSIRNLLAYIFHKPRLAQQFLRDPENIPGSRDD